MARPASPEYPGPETPADVQFVVGALIAVTVAAAIIVGVLVSSVIVAVIIAVIGTARDLRYRLVVAPLGTASRRHGLSVPAFHVTPVTPAATARKHIAGGKFSLNSYPADQ